MKFQKNLMLPISVVKFLDEEALRSGEPQWQIVTAALIVYAHSKENRTAALAEAHRVGQCWVEFEEVVAAFGAGQ